MAGPGSVQVPPDSSGKVVDMVSLSVAGVNVVRQVMALGGATDDSSAYAEIAAISASTGAAGVVVRPCTATVVLASGGANVGTVNLAAGTANIGNINHVSRTVQVAIGTPFTLDNISATVQVAIGTPFILQGISTTVQVAVATPYILQGISTTVTVAGNVNLSATAIVAHAAPAVMSASRGPKCVTASTSANVTLIASPGTGANIRITQLGCHNFSGTFISMRVGTSASVQTIVVAAQSSGGGAVYNFDPPWVLSASEAALCSVKPNAAYGVFNVQFYVV